MTAADLLSNGPRVVNVGLSRFADDLRAAGVPVTDVDWTPPASADARVLDALDLISGADPHLTAQVEAANAIAIERMLAADPVLVDVRPAGEVVDGLEDRMVLHAGTANRVDPDVRSHARPRSRVRSCSKDGRRPWSPRTPSPSPGKSGSRRTTISTRSDR